MIYNRTFQDVKNALSIRKNKIQKHIQLTEEELEILEKGFVTVDTLNRIEGKQAELKTLINNMGYFGCDIMNKTWTIYDVFNEKEFERVINNNALLRKSFFVLSSTPLDAIMEYNYNEFNRIEKILVDIESMIEPIKQRYRICGEYICGDE